MSDARPLAGFLWMLLSGVLFVGVNVVVKHVGTAVPPAEAAFLRYLFGLVLILPVLGELRRNPLPRSLVRLFAIRGVFHGIGVLLWFYAMTQIPLAEVTALNYLSPVYVSIGAAMFLGERLAARRIAAIVAALIGVVLVLRPGFREISPGHLAMLLTAMLYAVSYLIAKRTTDLTNPTTVVAMLSIVVTVVLAPFAAVVWVTPTLGQSAWLLLVAVFATGGHYSMTLAFQAAPVGVTQPVTFLQLVWAALLGWAMFGEGVDPWVLAGGTIIVAAVSFIAWREAMAARRRAPARSGPPDAPARPAE
jgi:drug/metabolite transporter (DMT)-like permease